MVAGERTVVQRMVLMYAGLALLAAMVFVPFAWMVSTSLKAADEVYTVPVGYLPQRPTFQNYESILAISMFPRQFMNSVIVSVSTAVLAVVLAALAGYGLSRFKFSGARMIETFVLVTQMFPGVLLVIP